MTTSTNEHEIDTDLGRANSGAIADALTWVRVFLTPIIMFVIIKAWSAKPDDPMGFVSLDLRLVLLASILFFIAAISDVLDDFVGGSLPDNVRMMRWFDDIADAILVIGTLLALLWVNYQAGILHWTFAIPALVLIGRDLLIGLVKGFELSRYGFLETRLGDLKNALAMFGVCILVASPWLTNMVDAMRASGSAEAALQVYDNPSHLVWNIGLALLWIAAILSLISGWALLQNSSQTSDETEETVSQ